MSSSNRDVEVMDHVTLSNIYSELKELNSRIDGLYTILITGDIHIPSVVTSDMCNNCQAETREKIIEIKKNMVGKVGFWSGVSAVSAMSLILGVMVAWSKLVG